MISSSAISGWGRQCEDWPIGTRTTSSTGVQHLSLLAGRPSLGSFLRVAPHLVLLVLGMARLLHLRAAPLPALWCLSRRGYCTCNVILHVVEDVYYTARSHASVCVYFHSGLVPLCGSRRGDGLSYDCI